MSIIYARRQDAPAHLDTFTSDDSGSFYHDLREDGAPEYVGADFVIISRDRVAHVDGWLDQHTLRCHWVTDPAVLARKANLPHYGPR
jgi:hypothetical protein